MRRARLRVVLGCLAALSAVSGARAADGLVRPHPDLAAAEVMAIQLDALQHNDRPYADAGIAQSWLLAHPANKRATGPYSRFNRMLRGPAFEAMLDHHSHLIEPTRVAPRRASFLVLIRSRSGDALVYQWTLERVDAGRCRACWMTTDVSPPLFLGALL